MTGSCHPTVECDNRPVHLKLPYCFALIVRPTWQRIKRPAGVGRVVIVTIVFPRPAARLERRHHPLQMLGADSFYSFGTVTPHTNYGSRVCIALKLKLF
jgi:hypothetical protein